MAFSWSVKVYPLSNAAGSLKANASLIIDDLVEVTGFRVQDGKNGLFVSAPSTKSNKTKEDGSPMYFDNVKFLGEKKEGQFRTELQVEIYTAILEAYGEQSVNHSRVAAAKAQTPQKPKPQSAQAPQAKPQGKPGGAKTPERTPWDD